MLGIIISIATIFVLISVSIGLQEAVEEQFKSLGTDKFFIFPRGQSAGPGSSSASYLTEDDVKIIEKVNGVKDFSYAAVANVKLEFNDEVRFAQIIGVPLEKSDLFLENGAFKIDEGRTLKEGERGAVNIGSQYKYSSFFSKPVKSGDNLLINDREFEVKGIWEPRGNPGDDRVILISIENFREVFGESKNIDQIIVQVNNQDKIKEVANSVEKRLRSFRNVDEDSQDFSILTPEELLESFGNILTIITSFLFSVAAISLLVGGIGIANTMFTSVLERTKEIGTMKALGAKNKDILLIFLIESGLLGLIGGTLGVILGASISKAIEYIVVNQFDTTLLRASLPIELFMGCLTFSFIIGAISGIWPAYRASKLKTVDALRYE
jgi:putative ABC transport system permease protein